jgi:polysaccharide biosynthesis protein PslJ
MEARVSSKIDAVALLTLYLVLLMAIPSALVFAPLGASGGPASLLAISLMILYAAVRLHPRFHFYIGRQPVRLVALLFLCSILASYISINRHLLPTLERNGADRAVISAVGWLAVLVFAADGIDRADRLKAMIERMATGAACFAVIGMIQFATGFNITSYVVIPGLTENQVPTDLLTRGGFNRPTATAAQPLEFAAVLVTILPLAIHQARFAPPGLRLRKWMKVLLIGAAIPLTVSRTAVLGLVVVAIVLLPTWPTRDRRYAYTALIAAVGTILVAVPSLLGTILGLFGQIVTGSASTDSRTNALVESAHLVAQHPWLGVGAGTFLPQTFFYTDDQYLNTLISTGVVGLVALIALLATGWFTARSLRRRSGEAEVRDLAQCLAAAMAATAACFGTFDVLGFAIASGLTFLLLGCIGAAWRLLPGEGQ